MLRIWHSIFRYISFRAVISSDYAELCTCSMGEKIHCTANMARIPLIINFSDTFIRNNPETFNRLRFHEDYFWTNDLLYNMMISIMGIEGAPIVEPQLDLSNDTYDRTKSNLTTLHGEKRIVDDNE